MAFTLHVSLLNKPPREEVFGDENRVDELYLTKIPLPTIPAGEILKLNMILAVVYFVDTLSQIKDSFASFLDSVDPEGLTFAYGKP